MKMKHKNRQLAVLLWAALAGAGLFAALNFAASQFYARFDLTHEKLYSVGPATRKLLASLPGPVSVTLYCSRELPPQIAAMKSYLADFLGEYAAFSGGKLKLSVREIGAEQADMEQALKAGVIPVRFDIYSKDRYEQREGFFGVALQYRDRRQLLPFVNDTDGLEYELSSRIKALLAEKKPAAGFVTSHGALTPYAMDPAFSAKLSASCDIALVDLASLAVSSDTVARLPALFVLGPQEPFSEAEVKALDAYLCAGGAVTLALDSAKVSMRDYEVSHSTTGLEAWLSARGLRLSPGFVLDAQNQAIQVSRRQGLFVFRNIVQYPPFVISSALDRDNPVTRTLDALVFPFASAVELSDSAGVSKAETLAWSSKKSWTLPPGSALRNADPFGDFGRESPDRVPGPFRLAVSEQGCFKPYDGSDGASVCGGRLTLVGTSRFIQADLGMPDMNFIFLLNLIDWSLQSQDLIDIRAKASAFHPLRELPPSGKKAVRYVIVLLPALLTGLAGMFVWRWRARQFSRAARKYSGDA